MAIANGISQNLADRLRNYEEARTQRAVSQRWESYPTANNLESNALAVIRNQNIVQAVGRSDNESLAMALETPIYRQQINDRNVANALQDVRDLINVNERDYVLAGAIPYRLEMSEPEFQENNWKRAQYLDDTNKRGSLPNEADDCVVRTLNEITGGENYGWAHETVTVAKGSDADSATSRMEYENTFREVGLAPVLLVTNRADPMAFHIDLREIPALLEISETPGLDYVVETLNHVVPVVNGVLLDSQDTRRMGDSKSNNRGDHTDYHAIGIWVKTDDSDSIQRIIDSLNLYRTIRNRDDILTNGNWHRNHIMSSP